VSFVPFFLSPSLAATAALKMTSVPHSSHSSKCDESNKHDLFMTLGAKKWLKKLTWIVKHTSFIRDDFD